MKNIEVIQAFLNKNIASSNNLFSMGDRLISYTTCIAEWNTNCIMVNTTKYSTTTSKIQNILLKELRMGHKVVQVENVPINTQYLWKHKEER